MDTIDQELSQMVRTMHRTEENKHFLRRKVSNYYRQKEAAEAFQKRAAEYPDSMSLNAMLARRLAGTPLTRRQRWKWLLEAFLRRRYY